MVVRERAPTERRVSLDGQDRVAGREDAKPVLLALLVLALARNHKNSVFTHEDLDTRHRDDSDLEAVAGKLLGGLEGEGHLGTGRNDGEVGVLGILEDVTTLGGLLDGRTSELREVLSGEGEDGRGVLGEDGDEVRGRSLVAIGRSPEGNVGGGSQPSGGLDRLVRRSVLTETDRVVRSNLDDSKVGKGRQSDGTGSVRDEVEECGTEGDDTSVGGETVTDGSHTVLSHTESEVSAGVRSETGRGVLEVLGTLPSGQVGAGQVGGTTDKLGQDLDKLGNGGLGQLSGSDSSILGGVGRESLLPTVGESTLNSSQELGALLGVFLLVLLEQVVPGSLLLSALLGDLVVEVVGLLRDGEGLLRVEARLLLELGDVVLLER